MLTSNQSLNKIFSNNLNLNKMDIFNTLADATRPTRPYNALKEQDKAELNAKDAKEETMAEIARKSHYNNRMSGMYDFLQLNDANENTYELGFMAGVMYAAGEQIKLHEKMENVTLQRQQQGTIADETANELIN